MSDDEVRLLREKLEKEREKKVNEIASSVNALADKIATQHANEDSLLLRMNAKVAEVGTEVKSVRDIADKARSTAEGVGKSMDTRLDKLTVHVERLILPQDARDAVGRFIQKEAGYDDAVSNQKRIVALIISAVVLTILAMVGLG